MPKFGIILFLVSVKWTVLSVSLWEMLKRKLKREHFIFKSKVKTQIKYLHSNFMQCITVESTDLIYVSKISIQKTHPFQFTENSDMRRASKQICIIYNSFSLWIKSQSLANQICKLKNIRPFSISSYIHIDTVHNFSFVSHEFDCDLRQWTWFRAFTIQQTKCHKRVLSPCTRRNLQWIS